MNGFVHTGITKASDGNLDSYGVDDMSNYSKQNTSEDSEPASSTENKLETETVVVEDDHYEDCEPQRANSHCRQ